MTASPDRSVPERPAGRDSPGEADELGELRGLLVGPEQEQLRALASRLDDPKTHAREISSILPEAIALRGHDPALTKALSPSVEQAITASVRRNPRPLSDALFPVMGPAIRKAIGHALSAMVESLNRTLEHSLSWSSLRWRVEAWRTNKSFSEVVLLKTLLFRVEQVFLIHRDNGLLLQHVAASPEGTQDADLVSGMLTAIRDFARDSFGVGDQESLEELQIGGLSVWIEQGPKAILAAVIRGNAPQEYRAGLEDALESIHLQYADILESFAGDVQPFESAHPILESCLEARYCAPPGKSRLRGARVLSAALLVIAIIGCFFWVRGRMRWSRYLERLRSEPGIAVLSTGGNGWRRVVIGLRDPLARDPAAIAAEESLAPGDFESRWEPYHAPHPDLALRRASMVLEPPASATLSLHGEILSANGEAPADWTKEARHLARLIPGIRAFDTSKLADSGVERVRKELAGSPLRFIKGSEELAPGQERATAGVMENFRRLSEIAEAAGRLIRIRVTGHADTDGSEQTNWQLSLKRAEVFAGLIEGRGFPMLQISVEGAGSSKPLTPGRTLAEKEQNRRVSFEIF